MSCSEDNLGRQAPINIGTYNIQSGRAGRLESALRAMHQMNLDIGILTETKLTGSIHTRFSSEYHVYATEARSAHQGGVALVFRDSDFWQVESVLKHGPNVISCELVTGRRRFPLVGVYIPPDDVTTVEYLQHALDRFPNGKPIVMGDFNVALSSPRDARGADIAGTISANGLEDMLPHFKLRQSFHHGNTWGMVRNGVRIESCCDYILGSDRRMFSNVQIKDPRCFSSDHYMVWARMLSAPLRSNRHYLKGRKQFPLRPDPAQPSRADALFGELKEAQEPVPKLVRERKSWVSPATWRLVDERASLRRQTNCDQATARRLGRQIRAAFKADRKARVEAAGAAIEARLAENDPRGAYGQLKAWYNHAGDRPSKPSCRDVHKVSLEFADLYRRVQPVGEPIPVMVAPFQVPDHLPSKEEIESAVKRLRAGKSPGPSGLRAEDLKAWLAASQRAEFPSRRNWDKLLALVQHAFMTGEIPEEMSWSVLVLIPKGSGGHRRIGLLDIVWKLISSIIDARLKSAIHFHDSLHGFRPNRGTTTAILEAKLLQQLSAIEQVPLYEIFIDLQKAYDTLDRERTLEILQGYGVGPQVCRLLQNFWLQQQVVARLGPRRALCG